MTSSATQESRSRPALAAHWLLDPAVELLNHGSFGACPRAVLAAQRELQDEMERRPVAFLARELPDRLDAAREELAGFLGAAPDGLAFLTNATAGVNAVVRSFPIAPGDELLTTDHAYNACRNVLEHAAEANSARVVVAPIPFPLADPAEAVAGVLAAVTPRTRLALLDHVTSPTGLVLPIAELVAGLEARGVATLVDGAHAPGSVELSLDALGASWYTGNLHKWVCAPKGAAFLWARPDRREATVPAVISHGWNTPRPGRSRFHDLFDWTGTFDPTAVLAVPAALREVAAMVPGGWPEVRRRNRELALAARRELAGALGVPLPCPDSMIASLAALPLPDA
ncbi:MAG TPA: aminotransferase class V-fold PLP-dependent enzyme, partial [Thermoanaerobaculia bacterium]|nr:aminotransferase class V-fold PLP-dependent enzyme [Thermoanaerobaculia bacterium]